MSDLVFPSLPGVKIEMSRSPRWRSTVHESVSGVDTAISAWTYPKWRYKLEFEVLRSGAEQELQQLVGFFNKHGGRADTWLFYDEDDCTAVDQQFGVGDGVTTMFYLVRDYGGFLEPVTDVKTLGSVTAAGATMYGSAAAWPGATLDIDFTRIPSLETGPSLDIDFLAGSLAIWEPDAGLLPDALSVFEPDYTYVGGGRIQFASPPPSGAPLLWSGEFYRRCRFVEDQMDLDRFLAQLWKARTIEFETKKGIA